MSCVNRDSFTFSFPIGCFFFWSGELITLAGTFSTMLNGSARVDTFGLFFILERKVSSLLLCVCFFFFFVEHLSDCGGSFLFLVYWMFLFWKGIGFFSASIKIIIRFLSFVLLIWFLDSKPTLHSWEELMICEWLFSAGLWAPPKLGPVSPGFSRCLVMK